jgi:hypothetical protein
MIENPQGPAGRQHAVDFPQGFLRAFEEIKRLDAERLAEELFLPRDGFRLAPNKKEVVPGGRLGAGFLHHLIGDIEAHHHAFRDLRCQLAAGPAFAASDLEDAVSGLNAHPGNHVLDEATMVGFECAAAPVPDPPVEFLSQVFRHIVVTIKKQVTSDE